MLTANLRTRIGSHVNNNPEKENTIVKNLKSWKSKNNPLFEIILLSFPLQ